MVKIQFANLTETISNHEYQKLCTLLPYWGLRINKDNEIHGFDSPMDIKVSGLANGSMLELNQLLAHTGIRVRKAAHPEFIISYKSDDSTQLSIRIHSVTYRFRPTPTLQAHRLQEHIFKNLWLPKRIQPIHIFIDPLYSSHAPEWLSYLLIQYAISPLEFKNLPAITLNDYQYFVSKYLMKINSAFAYSQHIDTLDSVQWPVFPINPEEKKTLFDHPQVDDVEDDYLDEDILDTEVMDLDSQLPIRPFRPGNQNRERDPINPFKIETSEQSIINPFRKKTPKE